MHDPVPSVSAHVLWREIDGDVTIFEPEENTVQVLNESASAIWSQLNGQRSVQQIASVLAAQYNVDPGEISDDVARTIGMFRRRGLLSGAGSGAQRTSVLFDLAGLVVKLLVTRDSPAERLCELLPALDTAEGSDAAEDHVYVVRRARMDGTWDLIRDGDRLVEGHDIRLVEKRFVADLNRLVRDESDAFSVHAGAVALGDVVIAFPGESGAGKSTTVAACVKRGFDYVTDEALLLDYETGAVIPFPKPIQLDAASLRLLRVAPVHRAPGDAETYLAAASLGGLTSRASASLDLRHVVLIERVDNDAPQLARLRNSEVVVALLGSAFNHYLAPDRAFELVTRLAERVEVWTLRVGDPLEAAELLRERFAEVPR